MNEPKIFVESYCPRCQPGQDPQVREWNAKIYGWVVVEHDCPLEPVGKFQADGVKTLGLFLTFAVLLIIASWVWGLIRCYQMALRLQARQKKQNEK